MSIFGGASSSGGRDRDRDRDRDRGYDRDDRGGGGAGHREGTTAEFKRPEPSDNIYMVGLPLDSTEESVKEVFEQYGTVVSVKLLPIKPGTITMPALLRMGTVEQAKWMVQNLHGTVPKGLNMVLTVRYANPKGSGKGNKDKDGLGPPPERLTAPGQMMLDVSGCASPEVSDIIKGRYQIVEQNHNKNVYKKEGGGDVQVLIYYWDDRDGPNFHGWWFGPKIGGDQVWAFNGDTGSPNPPGVGWKVPWNGSTDPSLKVTVVPGTSATALFYSMQNNPYAEWAAGNSSNPQAATTSSEVIQQRMVALKEKRAQEENMRQEQAAALVVRKVIQKLRLATPENFDELRRELESAQSESLEKMGSQAEKVMQEAEKAMLQAQEKVDEINLKKMEEEQKRLEEEVKQKEEAFRIDKTIQEARDEVAQVESQVAQASALGEPVSARGAEEDAFSDGMSQAVQAVEDAIVNAEAVMDRVSASLMLKKAELGVSAQAVTALKTDFKPLFARLAVCRRTSATLAKTMNDAKEKAAAKERAIQEKKAREAAAAKKEEEQQASFARADTDGDKKLNKEEVLAFAKAEYEFTPSDEHVDKWMTSLAVDGGISYDNFARLRSSVGIARSEVRAREKRLEEEAKEKEMAAKRAELNKAVVKLNASITEADGLVAKAVATVADIERETDVDALKEAATKAEASLQEPGDTLARLLTQADELQAEPDINDDAKAYIEREMSKARTRTSTLRAKLDKALADVASARERTEQVAAEALDRLRMQTIGSMRDYMEKEKKTQEDLFEEVCQGGEAGPEELAAFASKMPTAPEFKDGEALKMFRKVLELEGCESIGKDGFIKFIRLFYQVVRPTVVTDALSINGKVLRRLEVGEILERVGGSQQESSVGVNRANCRTTKDGVVGWVTECGNQGSAFLKSISSSSDEVKALLRREAEGSAESAEDKTAEDGKAEG